MHALQALFVLTGPRPIDGLSTSQPRKRWDDADRKARSAIAQFLGTQSIVAVGELLERETCSALEVLKKLDSNYKKET